MGTRGPGARPVQRPAKRPPAARNPALTGTSRADRVIAAVETLVVPAGTDAGKPLVLRPWQREFIRAVYATDAEGRRPVRTALASMARKNGKSTLAAALALVHLAGPEATPRGQVVSSAADRGQASIIYRELRAFVEASPHLAGRIIFREHSKTAEDVRTGSTFAALSSDARKAHGLSPTFVVADEVAQWKGRDLLDALRTGQGAHAEPLCIVISTRSPDPDSPLEELIRYAADVRAGIIGDPTFIGHVWSAPQDADPWSEATWRLANPGLGDFRSLEDVRVQAEQARRLPSQEAAFRAYILNQPVAVDDRWIGPADWDACAGSDPTGCANIGTTGSAMPDGPCYAGLDLSSGPADLTAFALYWPESGTLRVWAFLPSASVEPKSREDRAPYAQWEAAGHVVRMPGRAIDRAWLGAWIAQHTEGLDLQGIALDRWGLHDFAATLDREGIVLPLRPMGVGYKDFSPALSAFDAAVLDGRIAHGGNPLLRWAVANAAVDMDPAGNRKLSKQRSRGRIDPAVAAVMALGEAARAAAPASYEFTGMVLSL
jgi:phage terminase large subunit-like protein